MSSRFDGGPAFPVLSDVEYERPDGSVHALDLRHEGMSLGDWFAGQALHGLLAAGLLNQSNEDAEAMLAAAAYRLSKAMLAEKCKK